ncbi:hypothetical protein CMV_000862 [Castanea mollissima]|uniref:Uncharacterized protein n=1 Tax=Castanea mollissima TaxID=60419 RepID=A0A8J4VXC1_9ROSI|nr:hypothetical protein CMV_000862 [Castanea mollissima]
MSHTQTGNDHTNVATAPRETHLAVAAGCSICSAQLRCSTAPAFTVHKSQVGSAGDQNPLTQKSYLIWYWNKQTEIATPSQCFSYPKRPQLSQSMLPN